MGTPGGGSADAERPGLRPDLRGAVDRRPLRIVGARPRGVRHGVVGEGGPARDDRDGALPQQAQGSAGPSERPRRPPSERRCGGGREAGRRLRLAHRVRDRAARAFRGRPGYAARAPLRRRAADAGNRAQDLGTARGFRRSAHGECRSSRFRTDPAELFLLEVHDPVAVGEANLSGCQFDGSLDLRLSFHHGMFGSEEAMAKAATCAARLASDICADALGSFVRIEDPDSRGLRAGRRARGPDRGAGRQSRFRGTRARAAPRAGRPRLRRGGAIVPSIRTRLRPKAPGIARHATSTGLREAQGRPGPHRAVGLPASGGSIRPPRSATCAS